MRSSKSPINGIWLAFSTTALSLKQIENARAPSHRRSSEHPREYVSRLGIAEAQNSSTRSPVLCVKVFKYSGSRFRRRPKLAIAIRGSSDF